MAALKVQKLHYETGEILEVYSSLVEAARSNGILPSTLSLALSTRGGYMSKYRLRFSAKQAEHHREVNEKIRKTTVDAARYMLQHEASLGKTAAEFEITHATLSYHFHHTLQKVDEELYYRVKRLLQERMNNPRYYRVYTRIEQIDMETNEVIETYNSIEHAADDNFIARRVLSYALKNNDGVVKSKGIKFRRVS